MPRLLFSKTGNAVWISHLDTMRLFQRAFKRAGYCLKHTQGFNPRPSVSIAMPLSVGVESYCELLDFDLDNQTADCEEIKQRLNRTLIPGIQILQVYENGQKLKYLKYLDCSIVLEYDRGVPADGEEKLGSLFRSSELLVEKKSKNGIVEQNIIPMIHSLTVSRIDTDKLMLKAVISCQEPNLNPAQLTAAIEKYLPTYRPDFAVYCRQELLTAEKEIFR